MTICLALSYVDLKHLEFVLVEDTRLGANRWN